MGSPCVSGTLVQMARIGLEFIGRGSGGIKTIIKNVAKNVSETIAEKAAQGIARGANAFRRLARAVPNPWGKKGGPPHQEKVADVAADGKSRGLRARTEHKVATPGGNKEKRYVDVVGEDAQGNVVEMHQVGRQTKGGQPVSRERNALDDIEGATGTRPEFHPYN